MISGGLWNTGTRSGIKEMSNVKMCRLLMLVVLVFIINETVSQNENTKKFVQSQWKTILPSRTICGTQTSSERILNGEMTDIDEFPWMALLEYEKDGKSAGFQCGGALINSRYIVTAAHCVIGRITRIGTLVRIRLGEYDRSTDPDCLENSGCADPAINIPVAEIVAHPNYTDTNVNRYDDIALVRLARNVVYTDFVRPICLPLEASDISSPGERLWVAGWGRTEKRTPSPVKLKLRIPVVDPEICETKFQQAKVTISNRQLCAGGEKGRDSCKGDSGGPLMHTFAGESQEQYYLEGVVSFGEDSCGREGWPGVYTRVSEYIDWIGQTIRP